MVDLTLELWTANVFVPQHIFNYLMWQSQRGAD